MRIRSIKPEFCSDEKIGALTREERLHFIMLWMAADRDGTIEYLPRQLIAMLYPHDDDMEKERFEAMTSGVLQQYLCSRFTVNGKSYLHITNFKKHQSLTTWERKESTPVVTPAVLRKYCGSTAEVLRSEERRGEESTESPSIPQGGTASVDEFHLILKSRPELSALTWEQDLEARRSWAEHPGAARIATKACAEWVAGEAVLQGHISAPGKWLRAQYGKFLDPKLGVDPEVGAGRGQHSEKKQRPAFDNRTVTMV